MARAESRRRTGRLTGEDEKKLVVSLRLRASVVARIQRITMYGLANKCYPWKTYTETYEAMLLRGLKTFNSDSFIAEQVPHLALTEQFAQIRSARKEAETSLAVASQEIGKLLEIGAQVEALQYYHATKTAAEAMPPVIWRDWLLDTLKKAFPRLHEQVAPGVEIGKGKSKGGMRNVRSLHT